MPETCSLCLKEPDRFVTIIGNKKAHILCEDCMDPSLDVGETYGI